MLRLASAIDLRGGGSVVACLGIGDWCDDAGWPHGKALISNGGEYPVHDGKEVGGKNGLLARPIRALNSLVVQHTLSG